jgi:hypothetical protein
MSVVNGHCVEAWGKRDSSGLLETPEFGPLSAHFGEPSRIQQEIGRKANARGILGNWWGRARGMVGGDEGIS